MIEHRQIVGVDPGPARRLPHRDPERFLLLSPFFFDSSMVGLFWTLLSGGTIVLPQPGAERDVLALGCCRSPSTRSPTCWRMPSLHHVLADETDPAQLASLRTVIVAGEACTMAVVAAHRRACPNEPWLTSTDPPRRMI